MIRITVRVGGNDVSVETHDQPHLDEIVAIWLFEKFGTAEFLEKFVLDGVLRLGVGGGAFDEHPTNSNGRKEDECAATLVARGLGVDDDPALEGILKYVVTRDTKGGAQPLELSALVDLLNRQWSDEPEKVIGWTITAIEAKYREQSRFLTETKEEFDKVAQVEEIEGTLKMVTVVSDNEQMNRFARSSHGGYAAIVIQRWNSGNTQIFTNKKFRVRLGDVAQMIRFEEQRVGGNIQTTDWETLRSEGKVEGVEEWYYFLEGQMLLNGSLTARNVPPTKLSLERIKELVKIGVSQTFEPSRAVRCRMGECTSTRRNECGWYNWGLHRCRQIRYKMKNQ